MKMSVSFDEFVENCDDIVKLSSRFPGCEWNRQTDGETGELQLISHNSMHLLLSGESCALQYHITYSQSYNVPVLYFNAWLRDGKLLCLQDVWDQIAEMDKNCLGLDPWAVLTQQEHPYLHQPWFTIHPCKTEQMMRKLIEDNAQNPLRNYVWSWLSAVAHLVGLRLPLELANSIVDKGS